MKAGELKAKFVEFFKENGHAEIPSASLIPENDPTTLFISAGMHPLVPYLLGQPHPLGKRLTSVQKCVRTGDIDEVGDSTHHTFFEMLGNWSLGDYFKAEMIPMSFNFLTQVLNLPVSHLAVTCFAGDNDAPKDNESAKLWQEQGISASRIAFLPKSNNWWGPAGATGPCGPDTEMFYWTGRDNPPQNFDPHDSRWVEIWNDVFMQYNKSPAGGFEPLSQKNVDTGMGVERTVAVLNGYDDNYLTNIWQPIIKTIEQVTGRSYQDDQSKKPIRIIADHVRAAVFIINAGILPSNKAAGYVLRRLIRRAVRQVMLLNPSLNTKTLALVGQSVIDNLPNFAGDYQSEFSGRADNVLGILTDEEAKFQKTINLGLREINKLIERKQSISGKDAFTLYESFGFPLELIEEELSKHNLSLNSQEFNEAKSKHIEKSRTLSAGTFKSGLVDNSESTTKYHTATHLLHAVLRQVLGDHVEQVGSNITPDRLRFDFTHTNKLDPDQIKTIESSINQAIRANYPVSRQEMPLSQAYQIGALGFFGTKYPQIVSVYTVGLSDNPFSREICTGPHVANTGEIKGLRIIKEESAGAGRRRIYAVIEA